MVTNKQIKLIKSLRQKKYRNLHGLFVVEGIKTVKELLDAHMEPHTVFVTDKSILTDDAYAEARMTDRLTLVTDTELRKMSGLKTPPHRS